MASFFKRAGAFIASFFASALDPAAAAGAVKLYAKDDGGVAKLFSRQSDGSITNLSDGGSGTVTTDGTTIDGDGSGGDPITAIFAGFDEEVAVATGTTISGDGKTATPLDVVDETVGVATDGTIDGTGKAASPLSVNSSALDETIAVATDATLTGDGTTGNPLSVVGGSSSPLKASLGDTPVAIADTETVVISFTVPANTFTAGDVIKFAASAGRTGASATAPTFRLRIGPVTLTGAEAFINSALATANPGGSWWHGEFCVHTLGAAGKGDGGGQGAINATATTVVTNCGRTIDVAIDTTVDNLVEITFDSNTATNTYTFNFASLFHFVKA